MLQVKGIYVEYHQDIEVLRGVDLVAPAGLVTSVIGPNGAGKSTLLKTIIGILRPKRGEIYFDGQRIDGRKPDQLALIGMSYISQRRSVFPLMTVEENLELGGWTMRRDSEKLPRRMREVLELFPDLRENLSVKAGLLSGGQQRMLEIARALIPDPRSLLVDEPSFGLSPIMTSQVYERLGQFRKNGMTILLVDQNLRKCLDLSDYVYVMDLGVVKEGGPKNIIGGSVRQIIRQWLEAAVQANERKAG